MTHLRHALVAAVAAGLVVTATPASAAPRESGGPPVRETFVLPEPVPFGPCPDAGEITELAA